MNVCFLTQNSGLGEAIGRALGDDFTTRLSAELEVSRLKDLSDWWEAVVIDLSMADVEAGLRLMNEIISGIRVIKMYAWEQSFANLVACAYDLPSAESVPSLTASTYVRTARSPSNVVGTVVVRSWRTSASRLPYCSSFSGSAWHF